MGMAKKNVFKQLTQNDHWQPSVFKRYIFFSTLYKDNSTLAENAKSHFLSAIRPKESDSENYEKYLNYIQTYISNLEQLAKNEQARELQYVNSLRKKGMEVVDYYKGGKFDYIAFMRDLNLVHTDAQKLMSKIQTNISNFDEIKGKIENSKNTNLSNDLNNTGRTLYDKITRDYLFAYNNYINTMNEIIQPQLQESFSEQVNKKLQDIFSKIGNDPQFMSKLIDNLRAVDPNAEIISSIQNWCVEYIKEELIANQQDISKVVFDINKITDDQAQSIFQNSIEESYSSTMSTIKDDVEKIIDSALNRNENIANLINTGENNSLEELLNTIGASSKSKEIIIEAFGEMQKKISKVNNDSTKDLAAKMRSIAAIKGSFTKKIGELIRSQVNGSKKMPKRERTKIVKSVIKKYEKQLDSSLRNTAERAARKIKITSTSANTVAEILATPNFEGWLRENIHNVFIPGKDIQFKSDIVFNFSSQQLNASDLNSVWEEGDLSFEVEQVKEIAENKSKNFLKRYYELTNGHTSVAAADEAYRKTMLEAIRYKRALLSQTQESAHKIIEDYFSGGLEASISVKDYHYYNDEKGYHMGSMGGGGKVIDAVPNILKMLELGGISFGDTEVIITALLNSFEDSVIGTSLLDDIKNLLIGGAAMMLFDDGFANAQAYLERMKQELQVKDVKELPTGGSLHLLNLNGIYVPQSYVLFSIIEQLKRVYANILTETSVSNITSEKTKNSLELSNPMNNSILEEIRNDKENYPTTASQWNAVSQYAQSTVTIHFMFMGGMLDIMQQLEKSFIV